jgi:hypothetical protein
MGRYSLRMFTAGALSKTIKPKKFSAGSKIYTLTTELIGKELLKMERLRKTSLKKSDVHNEKKLKGTYVSYYITNCILPSLLINFLTIFPSL